MTEPIQSRSSDKRVAHYREQARSLRDLAGVEANEKLRDHLLVIADNYDRLADGIEAKDRP